MWNVVDRPFTLQMEVIKLISKPCINQERYIAQLDADLRVSGYMYVFPRVIAHLDLIKSDEGPQSMSIDLIQLA